jgi:hypothetical protein
MTVKQILAALPEPDRGAIMVAFESGEPYYVEYEPGRFVGVHVDALPHLQATDVAGSFRAGLIRRGNDATTPAG